MVGGYVEIVMRERLLDDLVPRRLVAHLQDPGPLGGALRSAPMFMWFHWSTCHSTPATIAARSGVPLASSPTYQHNTRPGRLSPDRRADH